MVAEVTGGRAYPADPFTHSALIHATRNRTALFKTSLRDSVFSATE